MSKMMTKWKKPVYIFSAIATLIIIGFVSWILVLNSRIDKALANKNLLPPTSYYSAPESFFLGQQVTSREFADLLVNRGYRHRDYPQSLYPGDFTVLTAEQCQAQAQALKIDTHTSCIVFQLKKTQDPFFDTSIEWLQQLIFDDTHILGALRGNPLHAENEVYLESELIAQFLDAQPIMQQYRELGEMPPSCLNAVLAIEDSKFLEHQGISLTSIARAALSNLVGGGVRQGGSTITQQMVKNFFLTSERTFKRKLTELFMSILLEAKSSKDQIFETYLNIIYLGQNGPFQVRGFGSAALHYFQQDVSDLNLGQCALLAAVLNSPGKYDPIRNPENATKRRSLVLDRMLELSMISEDEKKEALATPLPTKRPSTIAETAPYYVDAVNRQMQEMNLPIEGTKIYTGLVKRHQAAAQLAVNAHLDFLEKNNKFVKKIAETKKPLEGLFLSADNKTGWVTSLVGGRGFTKTQYNRAVQSHRQIGSIMKPFVYLTALRLHEKGNKIYTPLTELSDTKFRIKYEGQSWSPDNYEKKYYGQVPMYFALMNSLNSAAASLGNEIGLDEIISTAEMMGLTSSIDKVPSLVLGSFEMYPMEVLTAYMGFANFGTVQSPKIIRAVLDQQLETVFEAIDDREERVAAPAVASLVSMMKLTVDYGTARVARLLGFQLPAAGKTGTTSDNKDAWFAGFTPRLTGLAWTGYDDNTVSGLTGASGAVPIWTQFMKTVAGKDPAIDFTWPAGTRLEENHFEFEGDGKTPAREPLDVQIVIDESQDQ